MVKSNRNNPCPCGSGKKYKKCCYGKDQERRSSKRMGMFRGIKGHMPSVKTQKMMKNVKVMPPVSDKVKGLLPGEPKEASAETQPVDSQEDQEKADG